MLVNSRPVPTTLRASLAPAPRPITVASIPTIVSPAAPPPSPAVPPPDAADNLTMKIKPLAFILPGIALVWGAAFFLHYASDETLYEIVTTAYTICAAG